MRRQLLPALVAFLVVHRPDGSRVSARGDRRRPGRVPVARRRLAGRAQRPRRRLAPDRPGVRGTEYFHARPSAAGDGYDAMSSSASNLGPDEPGAPRRRRRAGRRVPRANGCDAADAARRRASPLPAPASTRTSRPRTRAYRRRVWPRERGLELEDVLALVEEHTDDRSLGFLGEPGVNVLELNLALDAAGVAFAPWRRGTLRHLPRRRSRRRQDLRDAERGPQAHGARRRTSSSASSRRTADDRPRTQIGDLEVRAAQAHRSTATRTFEEMDVDAILARRPAVALVDELAHTNVPGSRNEKRWQDVEELLEAGIDVISTLNIQHLESLNDVVEQITGIKQRETIPDEVVRRADQIELVDMPPRRSAAHGARQHLPGRADRRRARQLLPAGQPRRAARARAAVGRRPGRRRPARSTGSVTASTSRGRRGSGCVVALTGAPDGERLDPARGAHGRSARTAS